jgi:hypothetical protein
MKSILKITQEDNTLKIENESEYAIEIHLVPKKPKRRVDKKMIIHPNQYFILDSLDEWNTSDHYFRFMKP